MLVAINKIRESEPQVDYIILPKQAVSLIYLPSKDLSAGYESKANRYRPFFFFAITVIMQLFFYNIWYLKLECFFP